MKLTNEPILVRAFLGALLGTLVTVAGVNLAPEAIESILTLSDATMALLPTLLALVGSVSARWKVDGPVTSARKNDLIVDGVNPPEKPDVAKRSTIASLALLAGLPLLHGCGAALAWVTTASGAIEVARALLAKVAEWVNLYRNIPGIPVGIYSAVDKLLADGFDTLKRADALVKKGGETQAEAERLYASAKQITDDLLALLAAVQMYDEDSVKLVEPPGAPKRLRADGSPAPAATMDVKLPPDRLVQ